VQHQGKVANRSDSGPDDWREQVRMALDGDHPRIGRILVFALFALIFFSTISIGVETLPDLDPRVLRALGVIEVVTVAIFSIEYVLRIVTAPHPLRYIRSFFGIVDLVAILPSLLAFGFDLRALRAVRLLRLLRLLKVARYSRAVERMGAAFKMVREELVVFSLCSLFTLYICALGIYYFENEAQPEQFSSVFAAMWWAAVTLTTVGYGDVYPITVGGRIFTVLVLFAALGVIAIPTGLVSSALSRLRSLEIDDVDGEPEAVRKPPPVE
jgi:voltage-gated potassium channel